MMRDKKIDADAVLKIGGRIAIDRDKLPKRGGTPAADNLTSCFIGRSVRWSTNGTVFHLAAERFRRQASPSRRNAKGRARAS